MILHLLYNRMFYLVIDFLFREISSKDIFRTRQFYAMKEVEYTPGKRIFLAVPKSIYLSQYRVRNIMRVTVIDGDTCWKNRFVADYPFR